MFGLGPQELLMILVLGVLLFGRKLPEVGRSLGKTFVEFKKGVKGMEEEVETGMGHSSSQAALPPEPVRPPQRVTSSAPRFEEAPAGESSDAAPRI